MSREENQRKTLSIQNKKILILSEDSKSFPDYFRKMLRDPNGFRFGYAKKENLYKKVRPEQNDVIIVEVGHVDTNCLKIIKHANSLSKDYHMIYCVFDELKNQKDLSYKEAMNLNIPDNVIRINSAPSYEFWVFMHFSNSSAQYLDNDKLIKALENTVRKESGKKDFKYNKSECSDVLFDLMINKLPHAIKHSKAVEKSNAKTGSKSPLTKIYQLIEDFQNEFS